MAIRPYKNNQYRVYFKYQGKQYSKIVKTKQEGERWEEQEKERLKAAETLPPTLMFSEMSQMYLADCKARVQPITIQEKYRHLTEFAEFIGHDFAVEDLSVETAKAFIAKTQAERTNKSANRRLGDLQACWSWHKHRVAFNPWKSVQPYPEEEALRYIPPAEDVEAVLQHAKPWEKCMLNFLLCTAARIGEVYQLKWEDVNFERKTVCLWTRKRRGGAKQSRLLPMSPTLLGILQEIHSKRDENEPYVFVNNTTNTRYQRLQPSVRYMLQRLCSAAKVKPFGFHALRHYVAQRLMGGKKASLVDIQLLLGHQRATTTDIYLKSLSSTISHVAEFIETDVLPKP